MGPLTALCLCSSSFSIALLLLVYFVPLVPYDVSTSLVLPAPSSWLDRLAERTLRWDAVFFAQQAERGYLYEHEWAFGWGWGSLMRCAGRVLGSSMDSIGCSLSRYAIAAGVVNILLRMVSVMLLYKLSQNFLLQKKSLLAALLHIISPAGIFLLAAYAETSFAVLSFLGMICFEQGYVELAGGVWGIACTFRSNGILWGLFFMYDIFDRSLIDHGVIKFVTKTWKKAIRLSIGGVLVLCGFLSSQVAAYYRYCPGRPWCLFPFPSIYSFVQSHYWNVGFLRYWTLKNLPNFFLAAPTLLSIVLSSIWLWSQPDRRLRKYAIVQMLLGTLALTNYHVQTITRIGSCFPGLYWWASEVIVREVRAESDGAQKPTVSVSNRKKSTSKSNARAQQQLQDTVVTPRRGGSGKLMVRICVSWILVQSILYAAFLPPA